MKLELGWATLVVDGKPARGYTARPAGTVKLPGVIVIQEAFGVDGFVRDIAERLASAGYAVIAPDLFSVGVVLYQLLTGKRPFDGDSIVSVVTKVATAEPKPIGELRKNVPATLRRIIERCLSKRADRRFQSGAPQTARRACGNTTRACRSGQRELLSPGPAAAQAGRARKAVHGLSPRL